MTMMIAIELQIFCNKIVITRSRLLDHGLVIIRWKIIRPWDNNYLEYIIEIYFFHFNLIAYFTQQIKIFSKKLFLYSQFEKWTIKSKVLIISTMTIRIIAFASICTRSRKLKYLILCVLVDCTRLSEKRIVIVIVPFSFSLLIFFFLFFLSFHRSSFSSYYQVYCELLCCENSNESRVFFLLSRANTDTIQIIRNNYSDT